MPGVQTGSSIMPGKVNPVIAEAVIQAGVKVIANDYIITELCARSTLQINEFMPLLSLAILESLEILTNVNLILKETIFQIKADPVKCKEYFDQSQTLITAFLPAIGYEQAEKLSQEFTDLKATDLRKFLNRMKKSKITKQQNRIRRKAIRPFGGVYPER